MINKISFSHYTYNPIFKAEFSKDNKTTEILNNFAKNSPVETFVMLNEIKKINSNDTLSISREEGWHEGFYYPDEDPANIYYLENKKNGFYIKDSDTNGDTASVVKYFNSILLCEENRDFKKLFPNVKSNSETNKKNLDYIISNAENNLYKITKSEDIKEKLNILDTEIGNYQKKSEEIKKRIHDLDATKNKLLKTKNTIFTKYVTSKITNEN